MYLKINLQLLVSALAVNDDDTFSDANSRLMKKRHRVYKLVRNLQKEFGCKKRQHTILTVTLDNVRSTMDTEPLSLDQKMFFNGVNNEIIQQFDNIYVYIKSIQLPEILGQLRTANVKEFAGIIDTLKNLIDNVATKYVQLKGFVNGIKINIPQNAKKLEEKYAHLLNTLIGIEKKDAITDIYIELNNILNTLEIKSE